MYSAYSYSQNPASVEDFFKKDPRILILSFGVAVIIAVVLFALFSKPKSK